MTNPTPETIFYINERTREVFRLSPKFFELTPNQAQFAPYTFDAKQGHLVPPEGYDNDDIHTFHSVADVLDHITRLIHDHTNPSDLIKAFVAILEEDISDFSTLYTAGEHIERELKAEIITLKRSLAQAKQRPTARDYLERLRLDFTNDYLTVDKFAEHNEITPEQAEILLGLSTRVKP